MFAKMRFSFYLVRKYDALKSSCERENKDECRQEILLCFDL